ncbi:MAG: hypothetical protein ABIS20_13400 [Thermoanaerobaculia bacterium]
MGATVGGTLAGIEKRPDAYVLMAGYPSLTHAMRHNSDPGAIAFQAPLDALHYVGRATPAKLLFQFAKRDEFITPWDAAAYLQTASGPKELKWYDTDHSLNEEARRDRVEWLGRVLSPP